MILVVGMRPDGTLFESWVERVADRNVWGGPIAIRGSLAAGEPALAVSHDGSRVALAYRTRTNNVAFRMRAPSGYLAEEFINASSPVEMTEKASPALVFTYLPDPTAASARERLVAALADSSTNGNLAFLEYRGAGHPWRRLSLSQEGIPRGISKRVVGRPGFAWVGDPVTTVSPGGGAGARIATIGRLYLIYTYETAASPGDGHVRMAMTHVDSSGKLMLGLDSPFDNQWSKAFGVDLLQPGEIALRAAESYAINTPDRADNPFQRVFVRPHADGISNLDYRNFNDWKVMSSGLCRSLATAQAPAMLVACAPASW